MDACLEIDFTIITVCLNARKTIEQTVKSVTEQNPAEYLILDGVSSDGTLDVLETLKASGHRFTLVSEPDSGIYDAFNKGLRLASGNLIGILNADDFYAPWALEVVADAYRNNPDADVFYGKIAAIDEANHRWKVYSLGDPAQLSDRMSLSHPAIFIPKKTYERWGLFDDGYRIVGDWELLLRLFEAGASFCPIDNVLTAYRVDGLSSRFSRRQFIESERLYSTFLTKGMAMKKITKMYLKYVVKRILEVMNIYKIYALYRDRKIYTLERSGSLDGSFDAMWESLR